jgi:hypothetical protein
MDCPGLLYLQKRRMPKAREAAEDALRIDGTLPEGHTSLAMVKWLYDWKWSEAEQEFRRALVVSTPPMLSRCEEESKAPASLLHFAARQRRKEATCQWRCR